MLDKSENGPQSLLVGREGSPCIVLNNRRSHYRLAIAVGMSSVVILMILEFLSVLISNVICSEDWCSEKRGTSTVYVLPPEPRPVSDITLPDRQILPAPPVRQEMAAPRPADRAGNVPSTEHEEDIDSPSNLTPDRDWYAIAEDSAKRTMTDRFDQEEVRMSMWRKTGSVMFQDIGEFDFQEPATIIANREFRVPVGVLGIGITIGSCFIGIPLAGIPVDRRSAGPNVIYCTDIYE